LSYERVCSFCRVVECCSVLQCVAVCCSVLQCLSYERVCSSYERRSEMSRDNMMNILFRMLNSYRVALVSRIDKIIGLFCKRALLKRRYFAKETYHFF